MVDAVILALVSWAAVTAVMAVRTYADEIRYAGHVRAHAEFVASLRESTTILIHDAGQVAWAGPRGRLVDVVGLKTPEVIPIHEQLTTGNCMRARSLDRIARTYSATHLVVLNRWSWPCVAHDLQNAGWTLKPIYKDLYFVFEITPPASVAPPHSRQSLSSLPPSEAATRG